MRKRTAVRRLSLSTSIVVMSQIAIVIALLAAWKFLPKWGYAHGVRYLNPYFVSSPGAVWHEIWDMALGRDGKPRIWPYLETTLVASGEGAGIGMILGGLSGLILSNNTMLRRIFTPFVNAANAIPRIALIPIIVIIVGPNETSAVVTAVLVVYFLAFFSALEGGRNIAPEIIQNLRILGAKRRQIMFDVRAWYVFAWIFAALPNILSFSVITVVTAEILTGSSGVGRLLITAVTNADAELTYALVAYLGVAGALVLYGAEAVRRHLLHWWVSG
jgi:NitT/TauT family transport system permease protein